jgi:CubicO group peptidase (beta-lactamase class C family)
MPSDDALECVACGDVGFVADLPDRFAQAREAGVLPNIHGVIAARYGRIFFETYLTGTDSAGPRPLGVVRFGPDTLHDMRSVTKSVVSLLYGIAHAAGHVPGPDATLIDHFPEYADLATDPERRRLTVAHALSMTLGTEWDELTLPYSDTRNSEIAMDRAADRCRYALEQRIIEPPGQRWIYNGGATALLARLIQTGTARPLQDFAREVLFDPLGIGPTEWRTHVHKEVSAASGLRMTPRDLLRIGIVLLAGGRRQARQLIPQDWLNAAFAPRVSLPDGGNFGYHWYLGSVPTDNGAGGVLWEKRISAIGNGGQRLFLLPRLDLAVVVTAGNYNTPDGWRPPMALLRDVLLPAL